MENVLNFSHKVLTINKNVERNEQKWVEKRKKIWAEENTR
jgi:hypothetical protein